jgi:hypothetical protein
MDMQQQQQHLYPNPGVREKQEREKGGGWTLSMERKEALTTEAATSSDFVPAPDAAPAAL